MRKALNFALIAVMLASCAVQQPLEKPRVIVTCDPELDDHNSLLRYLLYSTDFDTEGLIYASSQVHWKGDGVTPQFIPGREYDRMGLGPQTTWRWADGERFIHEDVEAYEKVYPNLIKHNPAYPEPAELKSVIREGNITFEGDISVDTPGSDLIKQVLLDDDPRPVFIQVWGGPSTAARALKSIEEEYSGTPHWDTVKAKVSAKCKLCLSGCQDTSFPDYIQPHWPDVESVIINAGVTPIGYGASRMVSNLSDTLYYSASWTRENISSKDLLGGLYRVWGDGKQMVPGDMADYFGLSGYTAEQIRAMGYKVWTAIGAPGSFISEGDTPQFLNLIGNGLRAWEDPVWGGWAGRQRELNAKEKERGYAVTFAIRGGKDDVLPDFVPAVQNGFAARMAWSTTDDFHTVNHEPIVKGPVAVNVSAGKKVKLSVKVTDPDGDSLTCRWSQYKVGSYKGDVMIDAPDSSEVSVYVPADAKPGETIHLVLTVTDDGKPQLTSYLRTIITVK